MNVHAKAEALIEEIHKSQLMVPKTILFGRNVLDRLGEIVFPLAWGQKALVVLGAKSARESGLADRIHTLLTRYTVQVVESPRVAREPTAAMVDEAAAIARELKPKVILSAGGGSVIDFGKAIAALATNPGPVEDYLEGVGKCLKVEHDPLPHVAIPTVPGTGAEMTKNAVIHSAGKACKRSMRSDRMIPTVALIDPALTITVPPRITASGGMDTLTQLIEPCISIKRRKETSDLAHEGLQLMRQSLAICYEDADNLAAREHVALASMLSGVCLANAGLAMAHGIAAALGALHEVPHGLACGILLPHTLRYNRQACAEPLAQALAAFLNEKTADAKTIDRGIEAIESLNRWLQIPQDLKYLSLSHADLERIAEASTGTSMSGNPIPMTPELTLRFLETIA